MKPSSFRRKLLLLCSAFVALPSIALAQGNKQPIKFVVGFPPGGATDAIVRIITEQLFTELDQPVIVENKPGAGGRIAADSVLRSPADGLTFMAAPNATPIFQMLVFKDQVKWDITEDFTPVASMVSYPLGMAVSKKTGATNVNEFIEWAKKNPEQSNYGTPGLGGQNAFLGEQFANIADIKLPIVPYKGSAPMISDLIGGHVASGISLVDGMLPHHDAGNIQVIGLFTKERSSLLPNIPTFLEQGVDVTIGTAWTGVWAKKGTPEADVKRVRDAIERVLAKPKVKETLMKNLWVEPDFRDGAGLDELQRNDLAVWGEIIEKSKFSPDSGKKL